MGLTGDPLEQTMFWIDQGITARRLDIVGQRDAYRKVLVVCLRTGLARPPEEPPLVEGVVVTPEPPPALVYDRLDATERALNAALRHHPEARSLRAVQAWERLNQGAA